MNMYTSYHYYRDELRYRQQSEKAELMKLNSEGKVGWAILWLMGIPVPVLIILFLIRGCN